MKRTLLIAASLVLVLGAVGFSTVQKELLLREGTVVFLELAPVDPRSLIQGDYMSLRYAIATGYETEESSDGRVVLTLDESGVAVSSRRGGGRGPAGPDEILLRYRIREHGIRFGAEAFFFQEGHAERYANAKYGELRVADDGESVLVGLRDERLRPLR